MAPPASNWTPASFPPYASLPLACTGGVQAETEDAAFYTPYLSRTDLPQDVRNVFTNLQAASLENHLPLSSAAARARAVVSGGRQVGPLRPHADGVQAGLSSRDRPVDSGRQPARPAPGRRPTTGWLVALTCRSSRSATVPWRRQRLPAGWLRDPGWLALNGHFFSLGTAALNAGAAVLATKALAATGLVVRPAPVGSWPLAAQFLALLVVSDLVQWCVHNLLHRVPVWDVPQVHHSIGMMDSSATPLHCRDRGPKRAVASARFLGASAGPRCGSRSSGR
jgi:hypothetical protein